MSGPRITAILLASVLLGLPLSAKAICSQKFCDAKSSPLGCFRPVKGDLLTFMRSNPAGSLACFREQVKHGSSKPKKLIKELSQFTGVIGGDVKPDNVDIVPLADGTCDIGLIDLDDGGQGSLFGDFFHALTYNSVWIEDKEDNGWRWTEQISFEKAIEAYRRGLSNHGLPYARSLADILGGEGGVCPSRASVMKPKKSGDLCLKAKEWTKNHAPREARAEARFAADKKSLEDVVRNRGYEVIATGIRVKSRGGSMCLPRLLFLVKEPDKGACQVIEFKQQDKPAASIFGGVQVDHAERIESLLKHYRPLDARGSTIGVVRVNSNDYWLRTDDDPLFDGGEKPKSKVDAKRHEAFAEHMMHWLGRMHRKESLEYAATFERFLPEIHDELKRMAKAHVVALNEKLKQAPKVDDVCAWNAK